MECFERYVVVQLHDNNFAEEYLFVFDVEHDGSEDEHAHQPDNEQHSQLVHTIQ